MGSMRRWPKCSEADPVGRSRPAGVGRGAGLHGEVGEVEEQACMGRLGRGRSRPTFGGLGGGGAGLQSALLTSPTGPNCLHIAQTCLDRPTCPTNDPHV